MLVDCPKCGFSQPQDQYCAKCGVDMVAYRAKPATVKSRLLANPIFHISVIFIFVFVGALYIIREQRRQEIARRADYLKNGPVYAQAKPDATNPTSLPTDSPHSSTSSASNEVAPTHPAAEATSLAVARNMASSMAPTAATGASGVTPPTSASAESEKEGDAANKIKPVHLSAYFAAINSSRLGSLIEANHGGSFVEFGEFQVGTLENLKTSLSQFKILEKKGLTFASPTVSQDWFSGERNRDGSRIGITTKIDLRGFEGDNLRGEIEIQRSLYEGPDHSQGPILKAYGPAEFSLTPHATLMVLLSLPHAPQFDERLGNLESFLSLFALREFKQKQSEFVMLFDFE